MSPEGNRSAGNLLLLCIEHADEVDQPSRLSLYPAATLLEWKHQQLAYFDECKNGWQITQSEAEEVIRESRRVEVAIQADTVNLGGHGGAAPGAGGGGGGAIGPGARGGRGGEGGPIRIGLAGGAGRAPGAGGGGAGQIDPDSPLFWRGGDTMPTFGAWSFLGIDGNIGGDTTFGPVDGEPIIRARGGAGGRAGTGVRSESDTMVVSSLMLANYVEFREIFAYITGGCFRLYHVLNLGDTHNLVGIVVLECGGVPVGEYGFAVVALDPQDNEVSSVKFAFNISKVGDMLRCAFKFNVSVTVSAFGMWTIAVRHGQRELARLPIVIQQGVPGT